MTLKEIENKLKGNFEVSKMTVFTSYTLKLGKHGCITVQYKDNQFSKLVVDGNDKAEIEKALGVEQ